MSSRKMKSFSIGGMSSEILKSVGISSENMKRSTKIDIENIECW